MKFCSNCGLMIKPEALECNFCDTPIQDSIQNADSQQPIVQQPIVQQPMGQHQPMAQPQYMDQLQPMGQHQPMVQPQYMDQLQPMGQQPMGQQPMGQHQPMGQPQPIGQPQPPYHQPQQSYSQPPPFQQPTYQQSQQSHNQQSSGQQSYNGPPRQAKPGNMNVPRPGIGGWLLIFAIAFIINLIISLVDIFPYVIASVDFIGLIGTLREFVDDGIITVGYVAFFARILALGTYVLFAIAIVQIFSRKSRFLLFIQLSWLIVIFANILLYVASSMLITELDLLFVELGLLQQFRQLTEAGFVEIGISRTLLIGIVVGHIGTTLLFTLYFSKSHRVQMYMGDEEFKRRAIFAFNRPPA